MFNENFLKYLDYQLKLYNLNHSVFEKSLKFIEKENIEIIETEKYFLKKNTLLPEYIFLKGNKDYLKRFKIGMVGTRKPDNYGLKSVKRIIDGYRDKDVVTVSGFAQGVDTYVHKTSLENGIGSIAVIPCGFAINYPSSNIELKNRLFEKGLLLSEYSPFIKPYKHNFIKRNFMIAFLSDIMIIIQGAVKSGTLSTFLFSLKLKKQIFALPGDTDNKLSFAPNFAIFKGAIPLYKMDILPGISSGEIGNVSLKINVHLEPEEKKVIELVKKYGNLEDILKENIFDKSKILSIITLLEMKGIVQKDFNNRIRLMEDFDG